MSANVWTEPQAAAAPQCEDGRGLELPEKGQPGREGTPSAQSLAPESHTNEQGPGCLGETVDFRPERGKQEAKLVSCGARREGATASGGGGIPGHEFRT